MALSKKNKTKLIGTKVNCQEFSNSGLLLNINGDIIDFFSQIRYVRVILDSQLRLVII